MHRPAVIRYAGLAGSLLLAVAAYRGGARRPWHPTMTPGTVFHGQNGVLLPVAWVLGLVLLIGAWWVGRSSVPSARWAYVTAGLWALPLLFFLPLGSYDVYSYACQGWQQAAGLDPYAGGVDLVGCPWRDAVAPTWLSSPAPYGPVFLVLAAGAAKVGGSLTGTVAGLRVVAVLGVVLIGVALPPLARRAGVPLSRAVWLALACPLVLIHLISGAHNDAVMVGFMLLGLVLAADRRFLLAGLFFGLAVGVKATAVVVVPFAVLLAVRPGPLRAADHDDERPAAALLRAGGELFLGVAGVLLLVSLFSGRGLGWIVGLMGSGVSVQWTSPSTAVGMTIGLAGPDAVPVTRVIGIAVLVVVLVWLWLRARRGEPLLYAGLALAATVVLAPVFHPWYATWPLAALAATVRRPTRWLVIPPAVGAALCLPDGYNLALATKSQGAILMTVFLIVLIGKALHDTKNRNSRVARPDHDPAGLCRRDA
jgi:alpha-1,6-mannosyltransferase